MNRPSKLLTAWEVVFGAVLLLGLIAYVITTDHKDWWGLSAICYLSSWIQWTLAALALIALLAGSLGVFAKIPTNKFPQKSAWILLPILGAFLLLLHETFPLLGDGWLLVGKLDKSVPIYYNLVVGYPEPMGASFFAVCQRISGLSGQVIYRLFSIFSGIAIGASIVLFAGKFGFSLRQTGLFALPIFSSAMIALFAGYIENYPVLATLWTLTLLYALLTTKNPRVPFWPLIVAAPMLFLWHFGSLMLFPAIGYAGFLRVRTSAISQKSFLIFLVGLFALLLALYLLTPLSRGAKWILPISPANVFDGYSLFSIHHMKDFVNEFLLVAPLIGFLLAAVWTLRPDLLKDSGIQVLTLGASFGFIAAFVFNPELGMGRDWDLLATMLLPLALLAGYALAIAEPDAARCSRIVGAGFVSFFVIALPFLLVNHQIKLSVERYQDLLLGHSKRAAYGWEILAGFMEEQGDLWGRLTCLENAAGASPRPRYFENIAKTAKRLRYREKACDAVSKLRGVNPRHYAEANDYFVLFLEFGFPDEAERILPFVRKFLPPEETMEPYIKALEKVKSDSTRAR
ncbi:hypothetical protein KKG05_03510 [bacterium]|nr:hypothetical protein [bacterium]